MANINTTIEIFEMVKDEGISIEDATQRIRLIEEANIAKQLGIPINTKYSGGVVGKSAQSFNDVVKTINA